MAQDNIEEIKSKLDIVDVISEYLQLKRAGSNFKALCPFHSERNPSFIVSPDRQIWHCFSCGEGGDIFGFVMKMEGMEFPEALRVLAKKAGVQLRYQDPAITSQKTKLLDICKLTADFYHKVLLDSPLAKFARDYLKKRQVSDETVDLFKLGYAPESWDSLNKFFIQKKFKEDDIFLAGLTVKKEKGVGFFDRFRNRLMFPISDTHGNIIGFGGRWLGDEKKDMAKYINSPQTLIYNKSAVLYGIDKAKGDIRKKKLAIIVEGYMDCIASHQAGIENVVASSGTAMTFDQVKLIKRYTTNIAFAFDTDIAGEDASKRGIDAAMAQEMNIKIIALPYGKDPDECIKKDVKLWQRAIESSQSIMDYYFQKTTEKADLSRVEDKKKVAKTLLAVISKLADKIEQTHYLQKLAEIINVEERILREKLKQSNMTRASKTTAESIPVKIKDRYDTLSEQAIGLALKYPENLNYIIDHLLPEYLAPQKLTSLYKELIIHYTEKHEFDYTGFRLFLEKKDPGLAHEADLLILKTEHNFPEAEDDFIKKEVTANIKELQRNYYVNELKDLEQKIKKAEKEKDRDKVKVYSEEFNRIAGQLKQ